MVDQPRNRRSPQAAVREVAGPVVFEETTRRTAETRRTILPSDWDPQLRPPMVHGPTLVCG